MAPKNWQQVKNTFHDALRLESGERGPFLDKACSGDIDFRIEVESLLISLAEAKSFLEQPIIGEIPTPDSAWRVNDGEIISHYRIVSPIASGGMGEVYLAEDEKLGRRVALKILPEAILADRNRLRRFRREAEVISALNHPNILTIFEFGDDHDVHFFASEFVKGETLRARLRKGRLSLHDALEIAMQIASALRAAHEAGVIHRDIKPENVMIRDDGYVKVLDFGLAKLTEQVSGDSVNATKEFLSQPGVIMGTVSYMSPEQARARSTDARSDLFSFGVVLFEMLTGHIPFAGETTPDVIAGIIQSEPRTASSYNGSVPDEMDRIIAKCLEKDRELRYQTAADLLADLKRLSKSETTAETKPFPSQLRGLKKDSTSSTVATEFISNAQTTESRTRWSIRSIVLSALTIFLIAGGAAWLFWQFNKNTDSDSFDALRAVLLVSWKSGLGTFYTPYSASHDGKMIAYSSTKNGVNEEIYIKQTAGGDEIRVTKDEWHNYSPIWSPDDQRIAFVSRREGQAGVYISPTFGGAAVAVKMIGEGFLSLRHWSKDGTAIFYDLNGNLFRLDLGTREVEQMTDFPLSPEGLRYFSFSPDESHIAYCDYRGGEGDVWMMPRTDGAPVRLTNDKDKEVSPRWHPDGRRILYNVIRDGRSQINLTYTDGRPPVQVTRGEGDYELIDVSADGTKIFFTNWENRSDISAVKIESREETEVAAGIESEFWTDISPDGRSIIYQTNAEPHLAQFLNKSSIVVRSLVDESPPLSVKGWNPRWLPDSRRIAFLRWQKTEQRYNLWLVNTVNGEEKRITTDGVSPPSFGIMPLNRAEIGVFNWSPDSNRFVYLDSKKQNIWTASIESPEKFNQTNNDNPKVSYYSPLWSSDGKQIVYISMEQPSEKTQKKMWSIWVTEENKPKEIFSTSASLRLLGWSATGGELFLEMSDGEMVSTPSDVRLIQVSVTGENRVVTIFKSIYAKSMTLSTDGKAVAFTARHDDKDDLWTAATSGGEAKKITANRNSRLFFASLEWSHDGKTIYFDKQDQINTISMFVNFQ